MTLTAAATAGAPCPGCQAVPGTDHGEWCDHARCPECGEQLISCSDHGDCTRPARWHGVDQRAEVARRLGNIADALRATLSTTLKENAVKQDHEKQDENVRNALRVTLLIVEQISTGSLVVFGRQGQQAAAGGAGVVSAVGGGGAGKVAGCGGKAVARQDDRRKGGRGRGVKGGEAQRRAGRAGGGGSSKLC